MALQQAILLVQRHTIHHLQRLAYVYLNNCYCFHCEPRTIPSVAPPAQSSESSPVNRPGKASYSCWGSHSVSSVHWRLVVGVQADASYASSAHPGVQKPPAAVRKLKKISVVLESYAPGSLSDLIQNLLPRIVDCVRTTLQS